MTNMEVEVEGVVVDPHRGAVVWHECQPLAIPGDVLELRLDVILDPLDVDPAVRFRQRTCLEEHHRRHVHVCRARLEREER